MTCVLSVVVERKRPSRPELAALLVLTSGVMLAVWQGRLAGKPYAVMFCALGTLCSGAMMTFSSKLMSEKLDVVRLTFYTAPVSLLCLAPFTLIYEVSWGPGRRLWGCECVWLGDVRLLVVCAEQWRRQQWSSLINAPPCVACSTILLLQWDTFLRYYPEHRSSVVVIIAVTSVNAVLYNLVGAGCGCCY